MNIDLMLSKLSKSRFRSGFKLSFKDIDYIDNKGLEVIKKHSYDFLYKRLKDINLVNDGKQTPYYGHPCFISMHATATCCRGCLEKWYKIPKDVILSDENIEYLVNINMKWIINSYRRIKNAKD